MKKTTTYFFGRKFCDLSSGSMASQAAICIEQQQQQKSDNNTTSPFLVAVNSKNLKTGMNEHKILNLIPLNY